MSLVAPDRDPNFVSRLVRGPHVAYSFGYRGHKPADLLRTSQARNLVVVDVRAFPLTGQPLWRKPALLKQFGTSYQHICALGNANALGSDEIHIRDLELGLRGLVEQLAFTDIVIMCACADQDLCHRRFIVQVLRERGYTVSPLRLLGKDAATDNLFGGEP